MNKQTVAVGWGGVSGILDSEGIATVLGCWSVLLYARDGHYTILVGHRYISNVSTLLCHDRLDFPQHRKCSFVD